MSMQNSIDLFVIYEWLLKCSQHNPLTKIIELLFFFPLGILGWVENTTEKYILSI